MSTTANVRVVGLGEVLWDLLPSGPQLGGAPANFAYHAQALGARAQVISRVGRDENGRESIRLLQARSLDGSTIQHDETAPTGTVTVALSSNGIPAFTIRENAAWDQIVATPEALAAVREADAICYGTLAQRDPRSREALRELISAAPPNALRIVDLNLRAPHWQRETIDWSLTAASVLKLNHEELATLVPMLQLTGDERECVAQLGRRYGLVAVALTRGPRGSLLWTPNETVEHDGVAVEVRDTVGSGDAFTAALALGLLSRRPLSAISDHANAIAAFVCSQDGAMPVLPDILRIR